MELSTFLVQCLNAVQYGLLLFLVASGLTLIFGIMGVINLAHGSFYMLGAYMAFALAPLFGEQFLLQLVAGVGLSAVIGFVLEWVFFSYLYQRNHLQQVLMTYSLILVFEEVRSILFGNDVHGVKTPPWLAGGIHLGLYGVVNHSRLGMMIRAGASNRDMARGLGIDIRLLYRIVFAGGVALAALAGMIAAPTASVYPGMGGQILIICFVVVVIGGVGSISGALIASLLVGFVDTFGKVFFAQYSGIGIYVLMALVLIWKPEGLKSKGY